MVTASEGACSIPKGEAALAAAGPECGEAACITSLETGQTSVHRECRELAADQVVWRGLEADRAATAALIRRANAKPSVIQRFDECGTKAHVVYSESRRAYAIRARTCGQRWCPLCSRRRRMQTAEKVRQLIGYAKKNEWRMITLTHQREGNTLAQSVKELRDGFARLRRQKRWRETQWGGVAILEVKRGEKSGEWHPHFHCIVRGSYISKHELREMWRRATLGSFIVGIGLLDSGTKAASYVAKYLGRFKLVGENALSEDDALETYTTMKGKRLIQAFGNVDASEYTDEALEGEVGIDDWIPVAPLADMLRAAKAGDIQSKSIISALMEPKREFDLAFPEADT